MPPPSTEIATVKRRSFASKLFPLALYGGLASIILLFYTDDNVPRGEARSETQGKIILRRFCTGAVMYPLSRLLLDRTYFFVAGGQFANDVVLSGFAGCICGLILGSTGTQSEPVVGALAFAAGAMIIEYLL